MEGLHGDVFLCMITNDFSKHTAGKMIYTGNITTSNINCGGASTEAEKRAEKGRGRSKGGKEDNTGKRGKDYKEGGINQTAVPELDTPWKGRVSRTILHHLNVLGFARSAKKW